MTLRANRDLHSGLDCSYNLKGINVVLIARLNWIKKYQSIMYPIWCLRIAVVSELPYFCRFRLFIHFNRSTNVLYAPVLPWMTFRKAAFVTVCQAPTQGTAKAWSTFWSEPLCIIFLHWSNFVADTVGFICRWNKENHFVWQVVIEESAQEPEGRFLSHKAGSSHWLIAQFGKPVLAKRESNRGWRERFICVCGNVLNSSCSWWKNALLLPHRWAWALELRSQEVQTKMRGILNTFF